MALRKCLDVSYRRGISADPSWLLSWKDEAKCLGRLGSYNLVDRIWKGENCTDRTQEILSADQCICVRKQWRLREKPSARLEVSLHNAHIGPARVPVYSAARVIHGAWGKINTGKLYNTLLNSPWIKEAVKVKLIIFFNWMKMKTQHIKVCGTTKAIFRGNL